MTSTSSVLEAEELSATEKILAIKAGRLVSPGELVVARVDLVYAHDGTAPLLIKAVREELGLDSFRPRTKVAFVIDHVAPAATVSAAEVHKEMRAFARRHGIRLLDVGTGICHQAVPEEGLVEPGDLVMGADSHTTTLGAFSAFATGVGSLDAAVALVYGVNWLKVPEPVLVRLHGSLGPGVMGKDLALHLVGTLKAGGASGRSLEFVGVESLSIDSRMTVTNMMAEVDADAAIMPTDEKLETFYETEVGRSVRIGVRPGRAARYADELEVRLEDLEPMVAVPPDVDNVRPVTEVEGLEVDQVFIGSCTNGRLEDIRVAASILRGGRARCRCIVIPASRRVYERALYEGLLEVLVKAGCAVSSPTCGPCVGAHMGLLAAGEVAVSTGNRNFPGRMGHKDSKVYLVSPATAAATALRGRITDPREVVKG